MLAADAEVELTLSQIIGALLVCVSLGSGLLAVSLSELPILFTFIKVLLDAE